jgi:Phage integrase family
VAGDPASRAGREDRPERGRARRRTGRYAPEVARDDTGPGKHAARVEAQLVLAGIRHRRPSALRELRKDQARWKLQLGTAYDVRGMGLVFTDRAGAPRWPQDVTPYFKVLCGRAGIGGEWTPRELRHTFVSVLPDSGVDIDKIAEAVGHVNSTITKTVYRHQIAGKVTVAATAMDAIFGEASGS